MTHLPRAQHEYQGGEAASYESTRLTDEKWSREDEIVRTFLKRVATGSSRILDVPVGTGRFLPMYQELGCTALGVDISDDMLQQAGARCGGAAERIRLSKGDITALQVEGSSVDISVCIRFANLVPFEVTQRAVRELARVTRGHLILGVRVHGRRGIILRAARSALIRIGMRRAKLSIHPRRRVERLFAQSGLHVVERKLVTTGKHRSGEYYIYLLAVGSS